MPEWQRGLYRDQAIVLRLHKIGEADRIVTFFTKHHGIVRAVAKGVRKTTSRFGGRLEPFTYIEVQLYGTRSLDIVSQVETLSPLGKELMSHYPGYTTANAIAETALKLLDEEGHSAEQLFLLTLRALRSLAAGDHAPRLILDSYILRSLDISGFSPALESCASCGAEGVHPSFSVPAGGCVCSICRPPGASTPAFETMKHMVALSRGDWKRVDASAPRARREASGLIAALVQWHIEKGIRTLQFVEPA